MLKQELQKLVAFKADRKKRTTAGQKQFEAVSKKLREAAETGMFVCDVEVLHHENQDFITGPITAFELDNNSLELYDRLIGEGLTVAPRIERDYNTNEYENQYITIFRVGWM